MPILGLITEYNPFHHGHLHHLNESKKITGATHTVAVMSGHFMQRGEPALTDKWTRASMAVACGVDLVLELPTIFACSTAEQFARGSILLLDQLGCVTDVCFGSEIGDPAIFKLIGFLLADPHPDYSYYLKKALSSGIPFAAAQEKALIYIIERDFPEKLPLAKQVFNRPNNVLGMAYAKHIIKTGSSMALHTIQRIGAEYHDPTTVHSISSATGIRRLYHNTGDVSSIKPFLPSQAYERLLCGISEGRGPVFHDDYHQELLTLLKRSSICEFANLPDISEGLEHRIMKCVKKAGSIEEFMFCVKNKRVPYTRLQRMLIHLLLNLNRNQLATYQHDTSSTYGRILAFNDRGRELIRTCQATAKIPLINKMANFQTASPEINQLLDIDFKASRIYGAKLLHKSFLHGDPDLLMSPVYVK
ncbi:nucleotidyltransferase [Anoxynatronum buryatiense]|uniref:tRNA(Met) cytidine acetate ligase n=1 Tax=Anoxynatronum buryatiense TaxID=489973 RepID=A0AA46AI93_9CLOT|nr:nucleotidyltransferase [Anoxynatronum buryatiense]SMP47009.1 Predicted nucleotidyltransferase [Anoxynatronum buryatiense]